MGCPVAKKERSRAKDKRQGIEPLRERGQKARKRIDKPIRVYRRWPRSFGGGWSEWGHKFATVELAEAWIAKEVRGGYCTRDDFKIEGQREYSSEDK